MNRHLIGSLAALVAIATVGSVPEVRATSRREKQEDPLPDRRQAPKEKSDSLKRMLGRKGRV